MKNSNKTITIRTKIISIIFGVIFFTALPLSNLILNIYENRIMENLKSRGLLTSKILSETAFKGILMAHGDLTSVRIDGAEILSVYRTLFSGGLVMAESVMLSSRNKYNGIVISRISRDNKLFPVGRVNKYSDAEVDRFRKNSVSGLVEVGGKTFFEFISVSGPPGKLPICAGRLLFSESDIREPMRQLRWIIYGITFLAVLAVGLVSVFMTSFVSRPIARLTETVRRIEAGDMESTASVSSRDEIGVLTASFNKMMSAINESVSFVNDIIESMPSVMIAVTSDAKITHWNSSSSCFTGKKREDVMGCELFTVYSGFVKFREDYQAVLETGEPRIFHRVRFDNHPGSYYDVFLYPLKNHGCITGLVFRMDDVSLIEKKELQLQQAQKMEMIGTLSSGMAHEFNNILGGILGTVSIWKYQLENSMTVNKTEIMDDLLLVEESGLSAAEIVKQLLNLSGGNHDVEFSEFNLNNAICNVSRVCSKSLSSSIESRFLTGDREAIAYGNKQHIEQIILNLCINAAHSMTIMRTKGEAQGGSLSVSIHEYLPDQNFIDVHPGACEAYWLIRVSDTGVGMDEETMKKIFDPFFTTKEQGKGSGLGLSVVYSMIKKHNACIDVSSVPGEGTVFEVFIPALL